MLIGKNKLIARRASADTIELSFNSRCGPRGGIPDTRCGIISRSPFGAGCATFILCWREQRSVSRQLVINYNRMKFMLRPNKTSAALAGKVVDIYDFPDGRLEIRWKGLPLSYSVFDHLQRVSHAAIIEKDRKSTRLNSSHVENSY